MRISLCGGFVYYPPPPPIPLKFVQPLTKIEYFLSKLKIAQMVTCEKFFPFKGEFNTGPRRTELKAAGLFPGYVSNTPLCKIGSIPVPGEGWKACVVNHSVKWKLTRLVKAQKVPHERKLQHFITNETWKALGIQRLRRWWWCHAETIPGGAPQQHEQRICSLDCITIPASQITEAGQTVHWK